MLFELKSISYWLQMELEFSLIYVRFKKMEENDMANKKIKGGIRKWVIV